jgi:hypothetical protein
MPRLNSKLCYSTAAIVGAGALAALVAPAFQRASNCGGNSAALSEARLYWLIVDNAAATSAVGEFDVTKAKAAEQSRLAELAHDSWINPARYLVSTVSYRREAKSHKLLIVCDQAFRNVPQRTLWQAPPTHAAAYSDGTVELMSEAEFAALDRSSLVSLDRLVAETVPKQ